MLQQMEHGILKRQTTDIFLGVNLSLQRPQPSGCGPASWGRGGGSRCISAATSLSGENSYLKNVNFVLLELSPPSSNLLSMNCSFSASPSWERGRAHGSLNFSISKTRGQRSGKGWRLLSWLLGQCPSQPQLCRGVAGRRHLSSPTLKGVPEEKGL